MEDASDLHPPSGIVDGEKDPIITDPKSPEIGGTREAKDAGEPGIHAECEDAGVDPLDDLLRKCIEVLLGPGCQLDAVGHYSPSFRRTSS